MGPDVRRLVGCVLLSGSLGTVHAWSLFIPPLEAYLEVDRGRISAVYSTALVCITLAVLVSHRLFPLLSGRTLVLLIGFAAFAGLLLAADASSWWTLMASYGLLFGTANGLGYAFALQRSANLQSLAPGLGLGLVTAAYALGAALAGLLLTDLVATHGSAYGLRLLAGVAIATGLLSAALVGSARITGRNNSYHVVRQESARLRHLWAAYGFAVLAGLTVLGHTSAIVEEVGFSGGLAVSIAGFTSAAGGVFIAIAAQLIGQKRLAICLPAATAVLLLMACFIDSSTMAIAAVAGVAFTYGAVIAIYPAIVHDRFGPLAYSMAYGRVFTAWGAAGLVGPLGAGLLHDATGGYRTTLAVAAATAGGSAVIYFRLSRSVDGN